MEGSQGSHGVWKFFSFIWTNAAAESPAEVDDDVALRSPKVCVCVQVAGVCGLSGQTAAPSVEVGSRPGLEAVCLLQRSGPCVGGWWRRGGPATLSLAQVRPGFVLTSV